MKAVSKSLVIQPKRVSLEAPASAGNDLQYFLSIHFSEFSSSSVSANYRKMSTYFSLNLIRVLHDARYCNVLSSGSVRLLTDKNFEAFILSLYKVE